MSPEAQRIAIAEACGWIKTTPGGNEGWGSRPRDKKWHYVHQLPDYLKDLNAMRLAFEHIPVNLRHVFAWNLLALNSIDPDAVGMNGHLDHCVAICSSHACQWADAFLKTMGKWVES